MGMRTPEAKDLTVPTRNKEALVPTKPRCVSANGTLWSLKTYTKRVWQRRQR